MSLILRNRNLFFNDLNGLDLWRPFAMSTLNESLADKSLEKSYRKQWVPSVDLAENDKEILLKMDIPGVKKEDVTIDFHDGILTISGVRESFKESEDKNIFRSERSFGSFKRSFQLDTMIDEEQITAKIDAGELLVILPKASVKDKKRIEIN